MKLMTSIKTINSFGFLKTFESSFAWPKKPLKVAVSVKSDGGITALRITHGLDFSPHNSIQFSSEKVGRQKGMHLLYGSTKIINHFTEQSEILSVRYI